VISKIKDILYIKNELDFNLLSFWYVMNYVNQIETQDGVDVGYHSSPLNPPNNESCVGKMGIDKKLTLEEVITLAHKTYDKHGNQANIIIKAGKNAKWYIKYCHVDQIDNAIETQQWRDTSRATMYVIEWKK
jgi:hypothetical protein